MVTFFQQKWTELLPCDGIENGSGRLSQLELEGEVLEGVDGEVAAIVQEDLTVPAPGSREMVAISTSTSEVV